MVDDLEVLQVTVLVRFLLEYIVAADDELKIEDVRAEIGVLVPSAPQ